jgi:hypothetical protein
LERRGIATSLTTDVCGVVNSILEEIEIINKILYVDIDSQYKYYIHRGKDYHKVVGNTIV